jgi:hypothetical protein
MSSMQCACALLTSVTCLAVLYFSTLSHKNHDFRKKILAHKMYFLIFCTTFWFSVQLFDFLYNFLIFCTTFTWNISHSKKNWVRYNQKCILVFMGSSRYSCPILKKLEVFQHICEKHSNIKLHENPPSESCFVPWGRRYRRIHRTDEANSFLCNFANAPKKRSMHKTSAFPIGISKWRWLFITLTNVIKHSEQNCLSLWLNRAFWDQLIVYYQQMHFILILFNLKCLKQ